MIDLLLTVLSYVLLALLTGTVLLAIAVGLGMFFGWLCYRANPCWCEGGPTRCGTCVDDGDRLMEGEG